MLTISSLIIKTPESNLYERQYIIDVVMKHWLGLEYEYQTGCDPYTRISMQSHNTSSLILPDTFFQNAGQHWFTSQSLPDGPLPKIKWYDPGGDAPLNQGTIPIIYGWAVPDQLESCWQCVQPYLWEDGKDVYLGIDIFGSAFFMLTRYEEYIKSDRDQHDRFPASASLAYQEGFLDRPIINEYVEILWQQLHKLWPRLARKSQRFQTILSHDVDIPWAQVGTGLAQLIRSFGGDVLKRKSPALALQRARSWQAVKNGAYRQDQNYTFDRIMDISEKNNLRSAFYFMTDCTDPRYDHPYDIDHPYMRQLLRDIFHRGHEIGMHSSYETYQDLGQTRAEFQKLMQVCAEAGIQQYIWGGRQHFLRWQASTTWRNWAEAGLNYDSTLTYAEQPGFRCGVCYEFPVFDLKQRQKLALVERPLIIMEVSVTRNKYKYPSGEDIFDYMNNLRQSCQKYNGNFTLLWHNDTLDTAQMWEIYEGLAGGAYA